MDINQYEFLTKSHVKQIQFGTMLVYDEQKLILVSLYHVYNEDLIQSASFVSPLLDWLWGEQLQGYHSEWSELEQQYEVHVIGIVSMRYWSLGMQGFDILLRPSFVKPLLFFLEDHKTMLLPK